MVGLIVLLLFLQDFTDVSDAFGDALKGVMGHGAAWGDIDGDGDPDLYVGGFCDRPDTISNRLLRNNKGTFERVPCEAVQIAARTSGAVFADLDNDGDQDLVAACNSVGKLPFPTTVFENVGGAFRKGPPLKLPETFTGRNVGVFDFDNDGLLDLLILEDRLRNRNPKSRLFRNKGKLEFEEAPLPAAFDGLGLAVADLNGDGRMDFFVAESNRLFVSEGSGWRDATQPEFAWKTANSEDVSCGAAFGDLDGDGDFDLVVTAHFVPSRNRLYRNDNGKFVDVSDALGGPVPAKCPHVEIQDFDNDGRPDIYMSAHRKGQPLIYWNKGGFKFEPSGPLKEFTEYVPAGPTADCDGDGDLDIVLVDWFTKNCRLMRNETRGRNWLQVKTKTLNALVRVYSNGRLLGVQHVTTGYGYASGQPPVAHFGLGSVDSVDLEVTIRGKKIERKGVNANQLVVVDE